MLLTILLQQKLALVVSF